MGLKGITSKYELEMIRLDTHHEGVYWIWTRRKHMRG